MAETEIPGSYRWVFQGGPKGGTVSYNETGAPSTIEGDDRHVYQLQVTPPYPADEVADADVAPDVVVSVYEWVELHADSDEVGGSWN